MSPFDRGDDGPLTFTLHAPTVDPADIEPITALQELARLELLQGIDSLGADGMPRLTVADEISSLSGRT